MKALLVAAILAPAAFAQGDLEGFWTNATNTPLERPAEVNGREFYSDAEMAANAKKAEQPTDIAKLAGTDIHYDFTQYGLDPSQSKQNLARRTSIIIDPPDGKLPPMIPEARQRAAARAEARKKVGQFDGPETRPLTERCIIWPGEGPPMMPEAYNSEMQIHQGPGYVAIFQEMIHDVRIIPLDGSPHPGPKIRQYMGDSRGHWEGKTLVVDTTNFNGRTNFRGSTETCTFSNASPEWMPIPSVRPTTVEDPQTWPKPWKSKTQLNQ